MSSFRYLWSLALIVLATASPWSSAQDKAAKPIFEKVGELTDQDPLDKVRKKSYSKTHEVPLKADKVYRIDLKSKDFDSILRIEDADGRQMAINDDVNAGDTNSRLIFKAPRDGVYRLIATSFPPAETGKFVLTITDPTKIDLFTVELDNFGRATNDSRTAALAGVVDYLNEQGRKITDDDANLAMTAIFAMEGARMKGISDWSMKFSKALEAGQGERLQSLSKVFEGVARRHRLMGNTINVTGTFLDGKKVNWESYRGKVVLVDYWATWCGPCIAELPNVKKLHAAYKDKGFEVVGVSIDRDGERLENFLEKAKLPWPCIYEKGVKYQPLADYYGVMSIPLAILVDKQGRVISMDARGEELERLLREQLGPIE